MGRRAAVRQSVETVGGPVVASAAMGNRLCGLCLLTDDVPRLAEFYAALLRASVDASDEFVAVTSSNLALSIYSAAGMEVMAPGSMNGSGIGRFTLELEVDDVDSSYADLCAAGVPIVKPPTTQPWGRRSVWIRDPDGNIVNLFQHLPERPSAAEIVREYFRRLFDERDLAVCEELLAEDYVDHDAPPDVPPGPDLTHAYVADLLDEYPDLRVRIDRLVHTERSVALTASWRGTHPSTGETFRQTGLVLIQLDEDGRLSERVSMVKFVKQRRR